jgi:hypothetical protein
MLAARAARSPSALMASRSSSVETPNSLLQLRDYKNIDRPEMSAISNVVVPCPELQTPAVLLSANSGR